MKKILFTILFVFLAALVFAQDAFKTSKLAWNQEATTLAEAGGYTYSYYGDAVPIGVVLNGVVCVGVSSPYQCTANFPAFTPGAHTLSITAKYLTQESAKSNVVSFTFVIIPVAPGNLSIIIK